MKFDTVIIGGGLCGLTAGIRLQQEGQRCVIVSAGQSALHFSSGSFDLLNELPDGKQVESPFTEITSLTSSFPLHPYSKMGESAFKDLSKEAELLLRNIGITFQGNAEKNHFRITPMGTLKPTWLTTDHFATSAEKEKLPWKKAIICNPEGFLDFYPQFIADAFEKIGTETSIYPFTLPDLDRLRHNPTEMRSIHIARIFERKENMEKLADILKMFSKDTDAIILPAFFKFNNPIGIDELEKKIGKPIYCIATLPPSTVGIGLQQYLQRYFIKEGGIFMLGDSIQKAEWDKNKVAKVFSLNHQDIPLHGDHYILATGNYFSRGLVATQKEIIEPIFGLDVNYLSERKEWYHPDIFSNQQYQQFGVKTNSQFQAILNGQEVENLFVAGAILEGFNPIQEGTGAGVSLLTALHITRNILKKGK